MPEWTDPYGTWQLHARGLPEDGPGSWPPLAPWAEAALAAARRQGRRDTPGAYALDALVALGQGHGGGAPGYEVMVRVDHAVGARLCPRRRDGRDSRLRAGEPAGGGRHHGPEGPFYKAVVTKGNDVMGVAHLGGRPNAHQRSALDWLNPTCAVAGCGARGRHCQTDHRTDWATSHVTVLELLDRL